MTIAEASRLDEKGAALAWVLIILVLMPDGGAIQSSDSRHPTEAACQVERAAAVARLGLPISRAMCEPAPADRIPKPLMNDRHVIK